MKILKIFYKINNTMSKMLQSFLLMNSALTFLIKFHKIYFCKNNVNYFNLEIVNYLSVFPFIKTTFLKVWLDVLPFSLSID